MGLFRREKKIRQCEHSRQSPSCPDNADGILTDGKHESHQPPAVQTGRLTQAGPCQICRQEQLAARSYRIKLVIGLFFPFALQALDVTIIASALPWIASDFNEISEMNWIISAFNLTSAAFIPFWGQMADIFGRHASLQAAIVLIMVGTALCTSAPTTAFPVLILGRALQGLGCAGVNVVNKVIMADKVSLKEYSKNSSIFALFGGLSYAIGPVIGGFLTNKNWRWCFGINLPFALVGMILVAVVLRPQLLGPQPPPEFVANAEGNGHAQGEAGRKLKARLSTIDFGGQVYFLLGMGLLILALTWGGASYPWVSAAVLIPLILGSLITLCFIWWQNLLSPGRYLARRLPLQRATIPWQLISQRNMGLLFYINFATGMAMSAVLYYVDIYFVLVKGYKASKAGIQLLYYTPGIGLGVYLAMYMCNFRPRKTFHPLFLGSIIEATGISVLAYALHQGHIPTIYGMMGLTGAGTGLRFMPGTLHGIGFFPNNIASVISMMSFAIPFGGAIAMTLMATVFNNRAGLAVNNGVGQASQIGSIDSLPPVVQAMVRDDAKTGIVWAFIAILPLMWCCVLAAACLGNVNITRKGAVDEKGNRDFSENITEGVYLVGVLRRVVDGRKHGEGKGRPVVGAAEAV